MKVVAGIDVGKQDLVVSVADAPVQRFANHETGITALLSWLRARAVTHVVCEATGGYECQVVSRLRESELSVHVAHPNRVRSFAHVLGQGAKTDPLDAQVLARYGETFESPRWSCARRWVEGRGFNTLVQGHTTHRAFAASYSCVEE